LTYPPGRVILSQRLSFLLYLPISTPSQNGTPCPHSGGVEENLKYWTIRCDTKWEHTSWHNHCSLKSIWRTLKQTAKELYWSSHRLSKPKIDTLNCFQWQPKVWKALQQLSVRTSISYL
jgi:hypothetical protein